MSIWFCLTVVALVLAVGLDIPVLLGAIAIGPPVLSRSVVDSTAEMVLDGQVYDYTEQDWSGYEDALCDAVTDTVVAMRAQYFRSVIEPDEEARLAGVAEAARLGDGAGRLMSFATDQTRQRVFSRLGQAAIFRGYLHKN